MGTICETHSDRITTVLPWPVNKTSASSDGIRSYMLSNLIQCSQGAKWIEMNANKCEMIPGLEFMVDPVTELGHLHNIIKDYVNKVNRKCCGRIIKALNSALEKEINSYYAYINTWVNNIATYIDRILLK